MADTRKRRPVSPVWDHSILAPVEFEVFLDIARGLTSTEIANKRGRSVKTISTHRERILLKTGMKRNYDIIVYCFQRKLVIPPGAA